MISALLIIASLSVPQPITYDILVNHVAENCRSKTNIDRALMWELVTVELKYNVPQNLKGMLLASACYESGFNPYARGDHKFSKRNKPKAIGLFQMWKWWERAYNIDRTNPVDAATAYMKHIKKQYDKSNCKFRSEERKWIAAWVTAIRSAKKGGRCYEKPQHLKLLRKCHRKIKLLQANVRNNLTNRI